MKIALAQTDIVFEDKNSNSIMVEEYVKQASLSQSRIVVFPEMTCTGFSMNSRLIGEDDSCTLEYFKRLSDKYRIAIVFGYVRRQNTNNYNCLSIVDKGQEIYSYDKIHQFQDERNHYQPGNHLHVCQIDDFHFTGLVCYDLRFPTLFQKAAKKSEAIFVIASWPKPRDDHWQALLKARAIENQCYIIGVNRVGEDPGNVYCGHSQIYDPLGHEICRDSSCEDLLYGNIDLEEINKAKLNMDLQKDQREDLYDCLKD